MEITQLQGLISECRHLQEIISQNQRRKTREKEDIEIYQQMVKQARIQITRLRYDLKYDLKQKAQKSQFHKTAWELENEIRNTEAINTKIFQQYKQLNGLVTKTRKKLDHVESQITKAHQKLQLQQQYKRQLEESAQLQSEYWELRSHLQHELLSQREEEQKYSTIFKEKRVEMLKIEHTIEEIDEKYDRVDANVKVQNEIIDSIMKNEGDSLNAAEQNDSNIKKETKLNILEEKDEKEFNKAEDLDMFQKAELQNIFQKKQFVKKEEQLRMGKILHQKSRTMFYGRIINLRNRSYNYTEMSSLNHLKTETNSLIRSTQCNLNTSCRLQELQKKKRIRTRETQMRRYSQHYKNFLQQSPQFQDEKQNARNILEVYQQIKKKPMEKRRVVGNIEIIKLMKQYNKKRVGQGVRGVSIQCEYQNGG